MKRKKEMDEARHPVGVVTQRTGLTSHALRAWERRYGVVHPARTQGGHRLYTDADVDRLRVLHELTRGGRPIGQIADLSTDELRSLLREDRAAGAVPAGASAGVADGNGRDVRAEQLLAGAYAAVADLDPGSLDAILRRGALWLSASTFIDALLVPLMSRIGTAWVAGDLTPGHEHLASAVVRRVTSWLMENFEPTEGSPSVVIGTPSGHRHELGAISAAVIAASEGWDVRYTGPDLPASDLALVAQRVGAKAVALSLMYPFDDDHVAEELRGLARDLPSGTVLIVGGRAVDSYGRVLDELGATRLDDYGALRTELQRLANGKR